MRKYFLTLFFALLLASSVWATDQPQVVTVQSPDDIPTFFGYVPGEIVIQFKEARNLTFQTAASGNLTTGIASLDAIAERYEVNEIRRQFLGSKPEVIDGRPYDLSRYHKIRFDPNADVMEVVAAYRNDPMIESAEPIGIHRVYATPNDGNYSGQWHLNRANDHDVDAPEAWDIETGSTGIIVAILDTGVRYFHKDLGGSAASYTTPTATDGNMWINWTEKNGTAGVDDDGNGYVDDWVGYDFVDGGSNCWSGEDCNVKDNDPRDFNGHGTHCAGNVSAGNNNGYGTCAPSGGWGNGTLQPTGNGVKAMACRIGWSGTYIIYEVGYVRMDFAAEAFYYAANKGVKIASCSWGSSNSGGVDAAINYFLAQGGMIFKAAGNDGSQTADYMCARTDIISVAATDTTDNAADFTTYGTWVDISAPGTGILSSYHDHANPANDYVATMDGTSMATPLTASVAALIWSQNPSWTAAQVRDQLYASADNIDAYLSSTYIGKMGAGRINAYNAVNTGPVPPVANFVGSPTSGVVPLTVNFTDQSTGTINTWNWNFGDGGTSTAQNPSHVYNSTGTFTVTLTVSGSAGSDSEVKTGYITVSSCLMPVANFVGSPVSGYTPLTVNFTDQTTGSPTSWSWTFGDGGTSTLQNPSHVYATAGTYTVTLVATNSCGSDDFTRTNYITVTDPPAQQCDDFNDGNYTGWTDAYGTWSAASYYLRGNSNTTNARLVSPFGSFSTATINCNVRMNTGRTQRKARIIFAYTGTTDYRYVEFDDVANRVNIGEVLAGRLYTRTYASYTFSTAVWYATTVTVAANGTVTAKVGTTTVVSYAFAARAGTVGVGFNKAVSDFDDFCVASTVAVFSSGEITSEPLEQTLPESFTLSQNFPNPFNPTTEVVFSIPVAADVSLEVYNVLGQRVAVLTEGSLAAGEHRVTWDASEYSSGVYFYRLVADDQIQTDRKSVV